ncbi:MAG: pyrimidine/purine nucleoside phosphorylase [Campylobacterales bacterium]|nr:pyrimidine/purine nucleoside phosphorylase [Campylobacterales bacterium]
MVENYENVSVSTKMNVYFDGKVTSYGITMADGSTKTLGSMQPGEYRFNTAAAEVMDMYSGEFEVKHKDASEFVAMSTPCSFEVAENSYFDIRVKSITGYCCSYA